MNNWRLDRKLTAMMVEDFIFDPIMATKVLLRLKVPPHEELRILWMWSKYFTNDDSGFSTGKSFTFAIISALRSILFKGRISGVISKTFAQGKLIFANFDRWYDTSPIFRGCIKHEKGKKRLVHGNDSWVAQFRGGSEIRTLPPDFLKDAERVRSERWNDGYFDEWTVYGNFTALNRTLIGRCTKENTYSECPVRQNHVHLASTPNFQHHPSYKVVKRINHQISQGNKDYGRFTCNYRHIPNNQKWKWLVSRKSIFHMQTSLPPGIVKSEIDGEWQKDGGSFYSVKDIDDRRFSSNEYQDTREKPSEVFIASYDVARGGHSTSSKGKRSADDFSLSIFRGQAGSTSPFRHALTVRKNGIKAKEMSGVVHKWHRKLRFSLLGYDPGGGGLFVKDELLEEMQKIDGEDCACIPIAEHKDRLAGPTADRILVPIKRGTWLIDRVWGSMQSDSVLVNRIHSNCKEMIERRDIFFGGESDCFSEFKDWDADSMREWLINHGHTLTKSKLYMAEMDLAISQLKVVDIDRDENKEPRVDSFGMYRFKSKHKKDSAYSIIYTLFLIDLWRKAIASDIEMPGQEQEDDLIAFSSARI